MKEFLTSASLSEVCAAGFKKMVFFKICAQNSPSLLSAENFSVFGEILQCKDLYFKKVHDLSFKGGPV